MRVEVRAQFWLSPPIPASNTIPEISHCVLLTIKIKFYRQCLCNNLYNMILKHLNWRNKQILSTFLNFLPNSPTSLHMVWSYNFITKGNTHITGNVHVLSVTITNNLYGYTLFWAIFKHLYKDLSSKEI